MELPSRDFFSEINGDQPADEFINELNEETRAVEEPEIPDVPDIPEPSGDPDETPPMDEPAPERFCTYDEEAALYVNLLSDTQKVMLPKMLEKRLITDAEREEHEKIESVGVPMELTDKQAKIEQKFDFLSEYKANVALNDDEKETIRKPLAACLKMWQSAPSPTYALLFAVVTVEFSRAMPFFSNDFKK